MDEVTVAGKDAQSLPNGPEYSSAAYHQRGATRW